DVCVAVDVAVADLPLVRARVSRRARVDEHDPPLELARIDFEADALDTVDAKLDRRNASVQRRTVVLYAGWYADRLTLDVHRDLQEVIGIGRSVGPSRERAADRDVQRRRSGDAGASRRFAARGERHAFDLVMLRRER